MIFLDLLIVQTLDWTVPYDLYKEKLVDHAALMLTMLGRVSETKQVLATRFNFRLRTPNLVITVCPSVFFLLPGIKVHFRFFFVCVVLL